MSLENDNYLLNSIMRSNLLINGFKVMIIFYSLQALVIVIKKYNVGLSKDLMVGVDQARIGMLRSYVSMWFLS